MKLNIKPLVDAKGLNRNQLSKELKIGYQATCNLYDGNAQRIYFDTLQRLCNVLECTPNDIFVLIRTIQISLYRPLHIYITLNSFAILIAA